MRIYNPLATVLTSVLIFASCGGSGTSPSTPTATSTPPTSAPVPTVDEPEVDTSATETIKNLIESREAAVKLCIEQLHDSIKPACISRDKLTKKIEQAGWCERWAIKPERTGKYVKCNTTNLRNVFIRIHKEHDRPEISALQAKWNLKLFDKGRTGLDPVEDIMVGQLSFLCDKKLGAKTILSVTDETSGVTGQPFISEFTIGFKTLPSNAEISHSGPDITNITFGTQNTLKILNAVSTMYENLRFKAREISTERQIDVFLHNLTTKDRFSADAKLPVQWSANMLNKCNMISETLSP